MVGLLRLLPEVGGLGGPSASLMSYRRDGSHGCFPAGTRRAADAWKPLATWTSARPGEYAQGHRAGPPGLAHLLVYLPEVVPVAHLMASDSKDLGRSRALAGFLDSCGRGPPAATEDDEVVSHQCRRYGQLDLSWVACTSGGASNRSPRSAPTRFSGTESASAHFWRIRYVGGWVRVEPAHCIRALARGPSPDSS
jgi:hypothetical protein